MRQSPFTGWLETSGPRLTSALRGAWLDLWGGRLSMRVCYAAIPFVIFGTSLVGELRNIQVPRSAAVTVGILLLLAVILLSSRGDPSRSEALCSYWGWFAVGGLAASPLNVWLRARAGLPRTGLVFYTKFFVIVFAVGFLCAFLRRLFIQQKKTEE